MSQRILRLLGCAALVTVPLLALGCDGGGGGSNATEGSYVGTWLEDRSVATDVPDSRRSAPIKPKSPNLRRLTLTADHTFKLEICKPDGSVIASAKDAAGGWKFDGGFVELENVQNNLSSQYSDWVPEDVGDVVEGADGPQLDVYHKSGEQVFYRRTGG